MPTPGPMLAFLLALAVPAVAGEDKTIPCEVPDDLVIEHSPLPEAAAALRHHNRLRVLAVGSRSTAGTAGSPMTSWPARLEAELRRLFPTQQIDVINRGRPRQRAADMLEKLDADVQDAKPDVVIWESGTLEAMRGTDVEAYETTLLAGVDRLAAAGIGTVLMDPQYSRASTAVINFEPYVETVRRVADMRDLVVFPRFRVMRYWIKEGMVSFDDTSAEQLVKVADQTYSCIGRLLAERIAAAVATAESIGKPQ